MNAPLPSFFRPPSTERDQTIMRPPNTDDFCLQVPNSSDYLIPLPGPRSAAENLLSQATGVTMSETVCTSAMPRMTSPATATNSLNDSGCWETSFMMPKSESRDSNDDDPKLISLDTPQQTPTTIKPPLSFGDKESSGGSITLDPSTLSISSNNKQGMSYANVHMATVKEHPQPELLNGVGGGTANNIDKITLVAPPPPFTIQSFNDRYKSNENHSEISC